VRIEPEPKARTSEGSIERLYFAVAASALTAAIAYCALRLAEIALFPAPNPVAIIASTRSGLVWRLAIALYIGGMGGIAGFAASSTSRQRVARWLARGVALCALLAVAQGLFAP
jgi:hypothetical protein